MRLGKSKSQPLMVVGMACLAVASVTNWYLRRHTGIGEDTVDFASGLLYGIAIGTLLLSIVRRAGRE